MFIYELPVSLYSFKLRLAIALKGASVELRGPPGGTYRSPEYRAINPAGTIPALVDGDLMLAESDAIVEYLDDVKAGAALLPSDPKQRARTRMLSRWVDMRLEPNVRALFPAVKGTRDAAAIAAADAKIAAALDLLETALEDECLCALGATPGLVDCGLTASLIWLLEMTPVLALSAKPGQKALRSLSSLQHNSMTSKEVATYQALVKNWVTAR